MKVLIIRFSSIGDIVLTTPVIRTLKTQLDDSEIHYLTKKSFNIILKDNPYIDRVHLYQDNLTELISELKKEKFDVVIDLHKNLRTFIIKKALRVKSYSFYKLNIEKWLMVNFKIDRLPRIHIVDRYMEAVEGLGVKTDSLGLDYFIDDKDDVPVSWLPETHQEGYIAIAIGAQHQTKKLPFNKLIELCERVNRPIVLLGGKQDNEMGEKVSSFFNDSNLNDYFKAGLKKMNRKTFVFNACGKFNLNQSASILKKANAVFTHDTGLMHIAAAFKKNIFSIWGNTIPNFGMYPYKTKFTIIENNRINCRPCSKIGHNKCPKGHFNCMEKIKYDFYVD